MLAYDCFLSHDCGKDEDGRDNHARVAKTCAGLKAAGLRPWFDEERMQGDTNQAMVAGIEGSESVVCFITKRYLKKAGGRGPNGDDDNCKLEFDYACLKRGVKRMITVVMERGCRNTREWEGTVCAKLGSKLFIDLSSDITPDFDKGITQLVAQIRAVGNGGKKSARGKKSPTASDPFIGHRVSIAGLIARPDLNGKTGLVVDAHGRERYAVYVDDRHATSETIALRSVNLRVLSPEADVPLSQNSAARPLANENSTRAPQNTVKPVAPVRAVPSHRDSAAPSKPGGPTAIDLEGCWCYYGCACLIPAAGLTCVQSDGPDQFKVCGLGGWFGAPFPGAEHWTKIDDVKWHSYNDDCNGKPGDKGCSTTLTVADEDNACQIGAECYKWKRLF